MYYIYYIGYLATFLETICFIPEVYKVSRYNKTGELSLLMYITLAIMMFLWMYYATNAFSFKDHDRKHVDYPLFIANLIACCFVLYVMYKIAYNKYIR